MDVEPILPSFRFSHRNRGMWCVKSFALSSCGNVLPTLLAVNTGRIHRAFFFLFIHAFLIFSHADQNRLFGSWNFQLVHKIKWKSFMCMDRSFSPQEFIWSHCIFISLVTAANVMLTFVLTLSILNNVFLHIFLIHALVWLKFMFKSTAKKKKKIPKGY